NEGDLVVHVNHGIARYRGLEFVDKSEEHAEETLLLEFAEGTKLYVPIAKIDPVQKYVGGGKAAPVLSKIGSSTWEKRKKRVAEGKQVGVLVPTTILAEQHHRSFSARMGEFPFVIEVVNRFRPRAEIREVLKRTAMGGVDILIGTHRILQKDVAFKDLGLVVIDEEQRFGVE